jgi:hypothetical protein
MLSRTLHFILKEIADRQTEAELVQEGFLISRTHLQADSAKQTWSMYMSTTPAHKAAAKLPGSVQANLIHEDPSYLRNPRLSSRSLSFARPTFDPAPGYQNPGFGRLSPALQTRHLVRAK